MDFSYIADEAVENCGVGEDESLKECLATGYKGPKTEFISEHDWERLDSELKDELATSYESGNSYAKVFIKAMFRLWSKYKVLIQSEDQFYEDVLDDMDQEDLRDRALNGPAICDMEDCDQRDYVDDHNLYREDEFVFTD